MSNSKKRVLSIVRSNGNVKYFKLLADGKPIGCVSSSLVTLLCYAAFTLHGSNTYVASPKLMLALTDLLLHAIDLSKDLIIDNEETF